MDDNYIVVEIEKPADSILNKAGDLSSKTTHATDQVIQYRDWLIYNHLYANQQFENIRKPSGLVVIGMEKNLNSAQKRSLQQHNQRDDIKIVGFDWLHQRAETTLDNLIKHGFERLEL